MGVSAAGHAATPVPGGLVGWLDHHCYPHVQRNWDDELLRAKVLSRITAESVVLDFGAGAGLVAQMNFRGLVRRVHGVDVDRRVTTNPWLDEARVSDGATVPYQDATFDVAFADNVLEHLESPAAAFDELARVLKPGGAFVFKTPNTGHYVTAVSRCTPHRFHQLVNRLRGRSAGHTFPTVYRANTRAAIRRLADRSGLIVESLELVEGRPEYLRFHALPYLAGALYERAVNAVECLAPFRILLIGALRKPSA